MSNYKEQINIIKSKTKHNRFDEIYPNLPSKKYDIIYADPPWHYNGKTQFDKTSIDKKQTKNPLFMSAANFIYPTLKLKELKKHQSKQ